jgi:hypothetical protein
MKHLCSSQLKPAPCSCISRWPFSPSHSPNGKRKWNLAGAQKGTWLLVTSLLLTKVVYRISFNEPKLYDVWSTDNKSTQRSISPLFAFVFHWTEAS